MKNSKIHWTMWLLIGLVTLVFVATFFTKKDADNRISFSVPKLQSKTEKPQ